jgi:mannose-6-phosphate isomerase-like protein (cupin superfamily)
MSQKIRALNVATTPTKVDTPYGEQIFELVGRTLEPRTISHSFAEVVIPPGKASRLHLHPQAEETYYILKGTAYIELGSQAGNLAVGDAVVIPAGTPHKIYNHGYDDLRFVVACAPAWEPDNTVWLEPLAGQAS